jgi:hypothetical protein
VVEVEGLIVLERETVVLLLQLKVKLGVEVQGVPFPVVGLAFVVVDSAPDSVVPQPPAPSDVAVSQSLHPETGVEAPLPGFDGLQSVHSTALVVVTGMWVSQGHV